MELSPAPTFSMQDVMIFQSDFEEILCIHCLGLNITFQALYKSFLLFISVISHKSSVYKMIHISKRYSLFKWRSSECIFLLSEFRKASLPNIIAMPVELFKAYEYDPTSYILNFRIYIKFIVTYFGKQVASYMISYDHSNRLFLQYI